MARQRSRRSLLPPILGGLILVIVAIAAIVWFVVIPDDDDPVDDLAEGVGSGEVVDAAELDGRWIVVPGPSSEDGDGEGEGTFAGYLVKEVFVAGAREVIATGRSPAVTGSVRVEDGTVEEISMTVDVTMLTSDEGRRDNQIRQRGLETDRYPEAAFESTEPIELPGDLVDGEVSTVTITGDLTLHGVTRPVTTDLDVRPLGDRFTILARVPIDFADFDIEAPSIGGFVTVADDGEIELRVNLARE